MRWAWLTVSVWLLAGNVSASLPSIDPPAALPAVPERLYYAVSWVGVRVGESTLMVEGLVEEEDGPAYHLTSTTRSNHVLRLLYPVRTRVESVVDAAHFLPVRFSIHGRQGFRTRDRQLYFDQAGHSVALEMDGRRRVYPTVDSVQDPLSALYYYRRMATMTEGEVVRIPVHERKRPKEIVVTAGPVETVKTRAGTFEAVRLKVRQGDDGLFLHEGDLTIWITADQRRLPVRVVGKVTLGTVVAELTAYTVEPPSDGPP
jgi:hypothetical protein